MPISTYPASRTTPRRTPPYRPDPSGPRLTIAAYCSCTSKYRSTMPQHSITPVSPTLRFVSTIPQLLHELASFRISNLFTVANIFLVRILHSIITSDRQQWLPPLSSLKHPSSQMQLPYFLSALPLWDLWAYSHQEPFSLLHLSSSSHPHPRIRNS